MNEKLWGIMGSNGELVTEITGEVTITTRHDAEVLALGMSQAFGKTFTPVYLK